MKHKKVHIDFETRSVIDLPITGIYKYAIDKSTDVLCLAYAFDEGPIKIWKLGDSPPLDLLQAVQEKIINTAHNASFEFMIWNYVCVKKYNWPTLRLSQLDCTMIRAYSMGLPGKLENASKAVGLEAEKDMKGHRIMLQLSRPRSFDENGDPLWWDVADSTPKLDIAAKYERLYSYCKQDIVVERELDKRLLPLSDKELALWHLDQKINHRGVYCDIQSVTTASNIVDIEKDRLNGIMQKKTKGFVSTCNAHAALKTWINTFNIYKGKRYKEDGPIISYKEKGETKKRKQWKKDELMICQGVGKDLILEMLDMDLPKKLKEVLLIRKEAAKSSNAKLDAMIERDAGDKRLRFCFQYYGAPSTGRWAGRGVQLQNMTRPTIKQKAIEGIFKIINDPNLDLYEMINHINLFHGPPVSRISDCIRGMLVAAPGKKLIAVDFAAIESRVLAWLAGQEDKLNIYRGHGKIYEHNACIIYGIYNINKITEAQRQVGKVAELALGFQGGVVAFQSMAKKFALKMTDDEAEVIKVNWRSANPNIVSYWYDLERAAISAVTYPGQKFVCGVRGREVTFLKKGSFLFCRLPSGRAICYPYPKMKIVKTPWGEDKNALTYKGEENYQFITKVAYGGLLAENITQATARCLLSEAMPRFENNAHPIVMHTHDEIVAEVDKNFSSVKEAKDLMCILPIWAKDLPIEAKGWEGERYRK